LTGRGFFGHYRRPKDFAVRSRISLEWGWLPHWRFGSDVIHAELKV
jgi:hypothetical protein